MYFVKLIDDKDFKDPEPWHWLLSGLGFAVYRTAEGASIEARKRQRSAEELWVMDHDEPLPEARPHFVVEVCPVGPDC